MYIFGIYIHKSYQNFRLWLQTVIILYTILYQNFGLFYFFRFRFQKYNWNFGFSEGKKWIRTVGTRKNINIFNPIFFPPGYFERWSRKTPLKRSYTGQTAIFWQKYFGLFFVLPILSSVYFPPYRRMHVCMYVWMYVCMYLCMSVYMYVCLYVCVYVSMSVCQNLCMYVCVCMYVCLYVCLYVCMSVYVYVCVCMYVYINVCLSVCMYVYYNMISYHFTSYHCTNNIP